MSKPLKKELLELAFEIEKLTSGPETWDQYSKYMSVATRLVELSESIFIEAKTYVAHNEGWALSQLKANTLKAMSKFMALNNLDLAQAYSETHFRIIINNVGHDFCISGPTTNGIFEFIQQVCEEEEYSSLIASEDLTHDECYEGIFNERLKQVE